MGPKKLVEKNKDELLLDVRDLRRQLKESHRLLRINVKRKEKELEKRYGSLLDHIADPIFVYDSITYRFLHCNKAVTSAYGYTREEILSITPFELLKADDFEPFRRAMERSREDERLLFTHFTKDHRLRLVELWLEPVYYKHHDAWMMVTHDITEQRMVEEELKRYRSQLEDELSEKTLEVMLANEKLKREIVERKKAQIAILDSEKKFRNVIEKSLDGIMLVDEKGVIIEWNKAQEGIFDNERGMVIGKKIWEVQFQYRPENDRSEKQFEKMERMWLQFLETGVTPLQGQVITSLIQREDRSMRDIQQLYFAIKSDSGFMMACTTRDITSQLSLEKQLMQSQKMEAMGTLAGGIAHDFNNVLSGIMGYTELALRKSSGEDGTGKYLEQVLTASRRASDLVKQILTFSRREEKQKEPLQISSIIKEAFKLLDSTIPSNIAIVKKINAADFFVLANPTQIHQVIMNLCTNAVHAMDDKGGIMEVRLSDEMVEAGLYKELEPGPHLRLSISDTGCGIKPELMDKIFEPFFTTKEEGEGTGMGLAVVHGIIKSHEGTIRVYSKIDEGTTFSILLPITVDVIHHPGEEDDSLPGGEERILVVEDDPYLVQTEQKLLEELGYDVTAVKTGRAALELFRKYPNGFDLVITDFMMPKMNGERLTREILDIRPDVPVLLCTGYYNKISKTRARSVGIKEIILKPIQLGRFARIIRDVLDLGLKKGQ